MHLRGVFIYNFCYNLQLNGKHLIQVSIYYVGEHHEICCSEQFSTTTGYWPSIVRYSYREHFNTHNWYVNSTNVQMSQLVRQNFLRICRSKLKSLTRKQLRKHRRVRLERLLYSLRCLVLRHCTGSKQCKKQTRWRVTIEVYNIASNSSTAPPQRT